MVMGEAAKRYHKIENTTNLMRKGQLCNSFGPKVTSSTLSINQKAIVLSPTSA
jgi:hypothetical protein